MPADADALLGVGVDLARQAGALLRDGLGHTRDPVSTKTSATDMVTAVDEASERLIVQGLRSARPGDAILAEEGTLDAGTTGVRWVVDPLDGTTNYHYGFPSFAVSIAAEVDGVPTVGVVADPVHDEIFTAVRGRGAFCNGRPVHCAAKEDLATALIGTGFSYERLRRAHQADVLRRVLPAVRDIRRAGAAAVDLCWVACARLDGFYERGLQPWDLAAGALIAREAGARVGDLTGGPGSGDVIVAAGAELFPLLRDLLAEAGADRG